MRKEEYDLLLSQIESVEEAVSVSEIPNEYDVEAILGGLLELRTILWEIA